MVKYLTIFLLLSSAAYAQGIDCERDNLSYVEKTVCSDKSLKSYDQEITQLYNQNMWVAEDFAYLIEDSQKSWLTRRNACTEKSCIVEAYMMRNVWYKRKLFKEMYDLQLNYPTYRSDNTINKMKNGFVIHDSNSDALECSNLFELITSKTSLIGIKPIIYNNGIDELEIRLDACAKYAAQEIPVTSKFLQNQFLKSAHKTDNLSKPPAIKAKKEEIINLLLKTVKTGNTYQWRLYRWDWDNNMENGLELIIGIQGRYLDESTNQDVTKLLFDNDNQSVKDRHVLLVLSPYDNCSNKYNNNTETYVFDNKPLMDYYDFASGSYLLYIDQQVYNLYYPDNDTLRIEHMAKNPKTRCTYVRMPKEAKMESTTNQFESNKR